MINEADLWPATVLSELRSHPESGVSVVVDPDGLLTLPEDVGQVVRATDWSSLRAAYERHGRRRPPDDGRLVIHVADSTTRASRDLPWDVEQAGRVVIAGFPGVRRWMPLWRDLDDAARLRFTTLLSRDRDPAPESIVTAVFGVVLPTDDDAAEFDAVVRLRLGGGLPASAWPLVRGLVRGVLARALAEDVPQIDVVQWAWGDWLDRGTDSSHHSILRRVGGSIAGLLAFGLLHPAEQSATGLPAWVAVGATETPPAERVRRLLEQRPEIGTPPTLEDWTRTATWWGAVRGALALASPTEPALVERAWAIWAELDKAFVPWLQANLAMLQTSSRSVPTTVDGIAPFLARRQRTSGGKVCLIVLDGMGFAQWSQIRDALELRVEEAHAVVAVAPSLTPFSRQAIFAGTLPIDFEDTIKDNNRERQRWLSFWKGEDLPERSVRYANTAGAARKNVPSLDGVNVLGVAVLAVDDQMHGANLLGDAEMAGALRVWLNHGFLSTLIENASAAGNEVWITSDHGNLEALPVTYLPNEGLVVDRHGERVRFYASEKLRDASRADGIAWTPPGLPKEMSALLFARGRTAFIRGDEPAVVHGGLSLDEMLVPFVRVTR